MNRHSLRQSIAGKPAKGEKKPIGFRKTRKISALRVNSCKPAGYQPPSQINRLLANARRAG